MVLVSQGAQHIDLECIHQAAEDALKRQPHGEDGADPDPQKKRGYDTLEDERDDDGQ